MTGPDRERLIEAVTGVLSRLSGYHSDAEAATLAVDAVLAAAEPEPDPDGLVNFGTVRSPDRRPADGSERNYATHPLTEKDRVVDTAEPEQERDDAHHIRSAQNPDQTLCGQNASALHILPADTTIWPDGNAACWTCWGARRSALEPVRATDPVREHSCLDSSGVIVCGPTEPHREYSWMDRPVTQAEIDALSSGDDLRECRVCHRRFTMRCNFDEDMS